MEDAEATTPAHFVIWFDKKDDGLIIGIQKPSDDGAASISGLCVLDQGPGFKGPSRGARYRISNASGN